LTLLIWQHEEHAASKKYRFNNIKNFFLSEETKTQTDFMYAKNGKREGEKFRFCQLCTSATEFERRPKKRRETLSS